MVQDPFFSLEWNFLFKEWFLILMVRPVSISTNPGALQRIGSLSTLSSP